MSWTAARTAKLIELYGAGVSRAAIARELGLTPGSVQSKLQRLGYAEAKTLLAETFMSKVDLRRMSILHLVDLKRAGHSASNTELPITMERPKFVHPSFFSGSSCGSPSAACAEG